MVLRSLFRELQHAYIERVAYYRSKMGGSLSLEEARANAYHACKDEEEPKRIYDKMMSCPLDCLDFIDLYEMWPIAPHIAEGIWEKIKHEARDQFASGHLATEAMYPENYVSRKLHADRLERGELFRFEGIVHSGMATNGRHRAESDRHAPLKPFSSINIG